VQRLRYMAWGEERYEDGAGLTDNRYTGQRKEGYGLYFYQARWYDPALGRFAQADSIIPQPGDPREWDRYGYVRNNPVNETDSSGHCVDGITTIPCLMALIAVTGFFGGAAIYEFNVSGKSWWESPEDAGATAQAGLEGMFISVGAGLTAGQIALLAPDIAMYYGSKYGDTQMYTWGATQNGHLSNLGAGSIASVSPRSNTGTTNNQTYCRYCSEAEVESTRSTGLLRGGRAGPNYFTTDDNYSTVREAQQMLALPYPPDVKVIFTIQNSPRIIGPSVVLPKYGQPGGGIEYFSDDPVNVVIQYIEKLK